MISIASYDFLNVIVEGEVTVQTLGLGLVHRGFTERIADERLLDCLIELCEIGFVECRAEPEYGASATAVESITTGEGFLKAWQALFGESSGPTGSPENKTITVGITREGREAVLNDEYDKYLPFLQSRFGWPIG